MLYWSKNIGKTVIYKKLDVWMLKWGNIIILNYANWAFSQTNRALFQSKNTQFWWFFLMLIPPLFCLFCLIIQTECRMQSGHSGNHSKCYLMVSAAPLVHQELWEISWRFQDSVTSCEALHITALKDEWFKACQNKSKEFTGSLMQVSLTSRKALMRKWRNIYNSWLFQFFFLLPYYTTSLGKKIKLRLGSRCRSISFSFITFHNSWKVWIFLKILKFVFSPLTNTTKISHCFRCRKTRTEHNWVTAAVIFIFW